MSQFVRSSYEATDAALLWDLAVMILVRRICCPRTRVRCANNLLHPNPYTLLSSALSSMFDRLNIEAAGSWY